MTIHFAHNLQTLPDNAKIFDSAAAAIEFAMTRSKVFLWQGRTVDSYAELEVTTLGTRPDADIEIWAIFPIFYDNGQEPPTDRQTVAIEVLYRFGDNTDDTEAEAMTIEQYEAILSAPSKVVLLG